eukprot:scaffold144411_cov96-Phaeocystis_antarctica.AAC.1
MVVLIRVKENTCNHAVCLLLKVEGVSAHIVLPHDRVFGAMAVAHQILLDPHLVQTCPSHEANASIGVLRQPQPRVEPVRA